MSKNHTTPTLYVMVGLPAAGKTTVARQLEREYRALRFTPDEWMNVDAGRKLRAFAGRKVRGVVGR